MPNSRRVLPTDRAIADARLMLDLIGLPCTLGSRPASLSYGTFRRGSFADFEIPGARFRCRGRHCRQLTQHIAAAPHGLDVVTAAGCFDKLFAQRANQNIDD